MPCMLSNIPIVVPVVVYICWSGAMRGAVLGVAQNLLQQK